MIQLQIINFVVARLEAHHHNPKKKGEEIIVNLQNSFFYKDLQFQTQIVNKSQ